MDPTLATFRAFFPEFDGVSDAEVELYLDEARDMVSDPNFGDCFNRAVMLDAAHKLSLSQNRRADSVVDEDGNLKTSSGGGPLTSATVGGMSVGYGSNSSQGTVSSFTNYYSLTSYGLEFLWSLSPP